MSLLELSTVQELIKAGVISKAGVIELEGTKVEPEKIPEKIQEMYEVYKWPETQWLIENKIIEPRDLRDVMGENARRQFIYNGNFKDRVLGIYALYKREKYKIDFLVREKVLDAYIIYGIYKPIFLNVSKNLELEKLLEEGRLKPDIDRSIQFINHLFEVFCFPSTTALIKSNFLYPAKIIYIFYNFNFFRNFHGSFVPKNLENDMEKVKTFFQIFLNILENPKLKELLESDMLTPSTINRIFMNLGDSISVNDFKEKFLKIMDDLYDMYGNYVKPLIDAGVIKFTYCRDTFMKGYGEQSANLLSDLEGLVALYNDPTAKLLILNGVIYPHHLVQILESYNGAIDLIKNDIFPQLKDIAFTEEMKSSMHELVELGIINIRDIINFYKEKGFDPLVIYLKELSEISSLREVKCLISNGVLPETIKDSYEEQRESYSASLYNINYLKAYFVNFQKFHPETKRTTRRAENRRAFTNGAVFGLFNTVSKTEEQLKLCTGVIVNRVTDYLRIEDAKNLSEVNEDIHAFASAEINTKEDKIKNLGVIGFISPSYVANLAKERGWDSANKTDFRPGPK